MIYDYKRGVYEDLTLQKLSLQADGSYQFMIVDGEVYKNTFTALVLYTDAAGASPIPGGVGGGNYEYANPDTLMTAQEALTGGTGNTVYAQFRVTNATYQGIDLWADFRNFGTYTSNAADYDIVGGSETVNSTVTLTIPQGKTRYRFNFDNSGGDIAPVMPNGSFDGQQVILKDTGEANMTRIKGPGFYPGADSGGMYLKNRQIIVTWNEDILEWGMDDCVTAEYTVGDFEVLHSSHGDMEQSQTIAETTNVSVLSYYGSSSGTTYYFDTPAGVFPVVFASIPKTYQGVSEFARTVRPYSITASGYSKISVFAGNASGSFIINITFKGKY